VGTNPKAKALVTSQESGNQKWKNYYNLQQMKPVED
jgi:hypothetical protein